MLLDRLDERHDGVDRRPCDHSEMLRYLASVYEEPNGEGERVIDSEPPP